MPELRPIKPRTLVKVLAKMGFSIIRQRGSHVFLRHADGRTTIVPMHSGEDIDRHLLNKIIKKDLRMSTEEFYRYL